MGNKIYAYNGEYWKVIHDFQYTGESVPFSLGPGRYLLICDGAQGGKGKEDVTLYGGRSMGILELKETKNFYATVGGNGGNSNGTAAGKGGYNGGGDGGLPYNNTYACGGGGGGASDIRTIPHSDPQSLLSRLIVAGGAGGATNISYINSKVNYHGQGGGAVGTIVDVTSADTLAYKKYPTQMDGYAFGIGMSPPQKTGNKMCAAEGASGGGGGWFGGYAASNMRATYESSNGGGGSGYVLTADSYKPEGYLLGEEYYLTDTFMGTGLAIDPQVLVCQKVEIFNTGDVIIFPQIGRSETVPLPEGKFKLKCWGGDGGVRYNINSSRRGGYAEGVLNHVTKSNITVNVGSSGIGNFIDASTSRKMYPIISFNGGGAPGALGNVLSSAGGGASDIRLYPPEYFYDSEPETGVDCLFIKMIISKRLGDLSSTSDKHFQMGELEFYDENKNIIPIESIAVFANEQETKNVTYSNETTENITKLCDGDLTTKFCCQWGGLINIKIKLLTETKVFSYRIYTANDFETRDPVVWDIYTSLNGTEWSLTGYQKLNRLIQGRNVYTRYFNISEFNDKDKSPEELSLLSRFIVAGGAGGHGSAEYSNNRFGGAGGGLSGNLDTSSGSRNGVSPGPGTQTSSPYNSSYALVCGDFGHGGNGAVGANSYGGAGGGGWFGGGGTFPSSNSDVQNGGSGGSGYVLTADSYKPEGYLLGEEYYLTETSLITGGNTTLPIGHSKVEIEVIECDFIKILCHDDEGYKYFNKDNNAWEYLSDEINIDSFNEYGSFVMSTDNGLLIEYEVLLLDIDDLITSANLNVVPIVQKISSTIKTKLQPSQILIDAEYDRSIYDIKAVTSRTGFGSDTRITLDVYINKKKQSIDKIKLFVASLYGKGDMNSTSKPRMVKPKIVEVKDMIERFKLTKDDVNIGDTIKETDTDKMYTVIDIDQLNNSSGYRNKSKQYLLKVGNNDHIPIKYYQINRYINESVNALTGTLYSCLTYIHNRELYICFRRDNTVRFEKMNLISGEITWLFDKPHSIFHSGYSPGCIAVDDDYIWLTRGESYGSNANYMYRINIKTGAISGYAPGVQIQCFGQIKFLDNHTLIWCNTNGVYMWDTNRLTLIGSYADSVTLGNCTGYFSMSNKLVLRHSYYTNAAVRIFDLETKTFSGITLSSNAVSISAYYNGKFYIAQTNKLYVFDEESRTIENTFSIPWTNPKTIDIQNGIIYLTEKNSKSLFVYDIKADMYRETYLAWTVPNEQIHYQTRTSSFGGMFFLPNNTLALANYKGAIKYNLGYKMNQHMFVFDNKHESEYEYDGNFVSFDDSYAEVHDGYIHKELDDSSIENVKLIKINKSEYNVLKSILFDIKQNTEEGGDENGEEQSSS